MEELGIRKIKRELSSQSYLAANQLIAELEKLPAEMK